MKIILSHTTPFALAHGGVTNIVFRTKEVLEAAGLEVEYLRWWDESQKGDILFHFGRPSISLVRFAKLAGYKVVAEHVMTGLVSRPLWKRQIQRAVIQFARTCLPQFVSDTFGWESFITLDMNFFPSPWDSSVASHMFQVPERKSFVLPYGVNDAFLQSTETIREDFLICTATITPRKRVVELAQACDHASVPLKIVGKPYGSADDYFDQFQELAARSRFVDHVPHITNQAELAALYRKSRGFVLLSTMETISQSAIEAAACQTPLLLSDMDWAHRSFGDNAQYCRLTNNVAETAGVIKKFHAQAESLRPSWTPPSWLEARADLPSVLQQVLNSESEFRLKAQHV